MLRANFTHQRHYTSDTTDFIAQLKHQDADLEQRQRAGRGRLWDKKLDLHLEDQFQSARVPQTAYVYYEYGQLNDRARSRNWFILK
jgi:hypothetical protein